MLHTKPPYLECADPVLDSVCVVRRQVVGFLAGVDLERV